MLPTFVIGLREGLEAALIVGIVAAFLRTNGRLDLLKWVWVGVGAAVVLCLGVGIGLKLASENLPYRQQEGLETVIALVAVVMVTYMIVWMRRHARELRAELEGAATVALDSGSAWALVAMAFLAVVREGFETAVFLVAAFNESDEPRTAATGALIGIVVACAVGVGIYRGGLHLDLARFFKITGVVLVFVAAGLVASAVHSAHEADWINIGQQQAFDLTWLIDLGSVQSSLLTGLLGLQPRPVVIEVIAWLAYLVPVLTYVLWPSGRPFPRRAVLTGAAATAVVALVAAVAVGVAAPDRPDRAAPVELTTAAQPLVVELVSADGTTAVVAVNGVERSMAGRGAADRAGRDAVVYESEPSDLVAADGSRTVTLNEVAELNGGRLPLGVTAESDPGDIDLTASTREVTMVWVDAETGLVFDAQVASTERTIAELSVGPLPIGTGVETVVAASEDWTAARADRLAADAATIERADDLDSWQRLLVVVATAAALTGLAVWWWGRPRRSDRSRPLPAVPADDAVVPHSVPPPRQPNPV